MDREIPAEQKRRRRIKTYLYGAAILIVAVFLFLRFTNLVEPKIKSSSITVSVAEIGLVEATIPASGIILPEYEAVITSPISAKIEKVFHNSGESITEGQSVMQLNKISSLVAYEKLKDEQRVNRNKILQLQLGLQKSLDDLKTQYSIKQIKIRSLETALSHEQSLLKIGGSSDESVKQADLNLNIAKLELQQLQSQINNQKQAIKADLKSLGYEININENDIKDMGRKLDQASISSPNDGVITWVNNKIGSEISEGEELVRIADLSSYKIDATISDTYAADVKIGRAAIVRVGDTDLRGKIITIQPTVDNGTVKFTICLNDKSAQSLRANLKVDVYIVTSDVDKIVRVKNGPVFNGSQEQKIFVLTDKIAVARKVKLGKSNTDFIEILSGVKAGEKVIISDMQDYMHLDEVKVQ